MSSCYRRVSSPAQVHELNEFNLTQVPFLSLHPAHINSQRDCILYFRGTTWLHPTATPCSSFLKQIAGMGVASSSEAGSKPPPPRQHVLVPPAFERDLHARSHFCKSSYDYLFNKPMMRRLFSADLHGGDGLRSTLFFSPPADKAVSVKANIGSSSGVLQRCQVACGTMHHHVGLSG